MIWLLSSAWADKNVCDRGGDEDAGLVTVDGDNYATLHDALEHADDYDTIYVCRGTWPSAERIERPVTLLAVDGPNVTRLDGFGQTRAPYAVLEIATPGQTVHVQGFAIVDGDPYDDGIVVSSGTLHLEGSQLFGNFHAVRLQDGGELLAESSDLFGNYGAGVHATGGGRIDLEDSRIWENFTGGLYLWISHRTVNGGEIYLNTGDEGGGVHSEGDNTLQFVSVHDNTGKDGAGIWHDGGTLSLLGCQISDNHAYDGGGLYLASGTVTLGLTALQGNRADNDGGGIWSAAERIEGDDLSPIRENEAWRGGGLFVDEGRQITSLRILHNEAHEGGGIMASRFEGELTFTQLTVADNVGGLGGGLHVDSPSGKANPLVFEGGTLSRNRAGLGGGIGVWNTSGWLGEVLVYETSIEDNEASDRGGAVFSHEAWVTVDTCDVFSNTAPEGAGATGDQDYFLQSFDSHWSNTPHDVFSNGVGYTYGTLSFFCTDSGCTP